MNDEKRVPEGEWKEVLSEASSQDDCCNRSKCADSESFPYDCGDCIFSSTYCAVSTFEQWKKEYLNGRQD